MRNEEEMDISTVLAMADVSNDEPINTHFFFGHYCALGRYLGWICEWDGIYIGLR